MNTKIRNLTLAAFACAALGASQSVNAQTAAATRPATPAATTAATTAAAPGEIKMAVIYTDQFLDPQRGIGRLIGAATTLEREFKPRTDEVQTMQKQLQDMVTKLNAQTGGSGVVDPASLQRTREDAERLQVNLERKQQDYQRDLARRQNELLSPISDNINQQLQAYTRSRGYTVIFDGAKLGGVMIVLNEGIDITNAFIADYNSKNPAGAAAAATTPAATTPAARPPARRP